MVQELRQIILSNDELISALDAHGRMISGFMPKGSIKGFAAAGDGGLVVTLSNPEGKVSQIIVDEERLLQALIRFCIENNIMLPREGKKSAVISDKSVSLSIKLDIETYIMNGLSAEFCTLYAFK